MDLIIVESPTKSKTLSNFLGKDYRVVATMGHIRDLPKSRLGIKVNQVNQVNQGEGSDYEFIPEYELMPKKKEAIALLKKEAKKAKKIFLATDPDREGEAIAYHALVILSDTKSVHGESVQDESGIRNPKFSRITFHEITKSAIEKALANPGQLNMPLVDAQQARRILDRLVGYKLSPLLWFKIRRGLSAGRVQSVAVRLIVDREREIEKFVPEEYWEIIADLRRHIGGLKEGVPSFQVKLEKINSQTAKIADSTQAEKIVNELKQGNYEVAVVDRKEILQRPVPPFTTSTMQQKAVQILHFSGKRTMRAAQSLYEKGLITYHRTDSVVLAMEAVTALREYIQTNFGIQYRPEKPNFYATKSKLAQEAHEAIRPTSLASISNIKNQISNSDEERLYEQIWKRAVASQMAAAVWDQTKISVQATGDKNIYLLGAEGKIIKFDGWLKVYGGAKSETDGLPELKTGDDLDLIKVTSEQKFTQPPPRYTEASLIKTLEEKGIGRPSTYAPIVSTIQDRQYVEKLEGKFQPTPLGITVNDFIYDYFPEIIDYDFTAKMENNLDEIALGKINWQPVVAEFYGPFEKKLDGVKKVAERAKVPTEATGEICPKCEQESLPAGRRGQLVIRIGRFGKFISCSRFPDCKYTAPFIQKLEGVKCPTCSGEVVIRKSKKGKQFYGCSNYPKCKWASWRKPK